MIALLSGKIVHKSPDYLVLDVGGVGYRVQIPFSTYYDLPDEGGSATLHIHTNVKEDAIHLYGFRTLAEKEFFQLLITVSGVGPKLAKDILSNIQPSELSGALQRGDIVKLSAIPGIGKKTAERLILELREKVKKISAAPAPGEKGPSVGICGLSDDVASALVNLGYKDQQVRKVLDGIEIGEDATVESVLKTALKVLMK
jgi:holliday junction DNA helicase RuvA